MNFKSKNESNRAMRLQHRNLAIGAATIFGDAVT
jgi:hypothetical protein